MRRSLVPASGACALWRMPTAFPSSASSGHPLSSARVVPREDTHDTRRTDLGPRSDDAPRRESPSRRPGCLSPPRHAKDSMYAEGLLPPAFAPALPLTPPTLFPQAGGSAFDGHCKVTVRSPAWSVTGSRVQTPFLPAGIPRLGLTTQARQRARPARPSTRTDCPARTDTRRSA